MSSFVFQYDATEAGSVLSQTPEQSVPNYYLNTLNAVNPPSTSSFLLVTGVTQYFRHSATPTIPADFSFAPTIRLSSYHNGLKIIKYPSVDATIYAGAVQKGNKIFGPIQGLAPQVFPFNTGDMVGGGYTAAELLVFECNYNPIGEGSPGEVPPVAWSEP